MPILRIEGIVDGSNVVVDHAENVLGTAHVVLGMDVRFVIPRNTPVVIRIRHPEFQALDLPATMWGEQITLRVEQVRDLTMDISDVEVVHGPSLSEVITDMQARAGIDQSDLELSTMDLTQRMPVPRGKRMIQV